MPCPTKYLYRYKKCPLISPPLKKEGDNLPYIVE